MKKQSTIEQIECILKSELRSYECALRTVQFTLYGLPLLLLAALAVYLFKWWLDRDLYELNSLIYPAALILSAFCGYAWHSFQVTIDRAAAVSDAKNLAELHGLKVIYWPGGKGISRDTLEVVDAANPKPSVDWARNWRKWNCLADLLR
ncbi:MAG: hypothetical protein U1C47_02365 [Hydrogenophaga sp.]|nr:hypothetical protein [Hydrogenophaga sp.]